MIDQRFLTLSIFAETLSFTKTAKKLFITQPAVSQQLKSLEKELQFPLIKKEHGAFSLTAEGKELTRYINHSKIESENMLAHLKNFHQKPPLKIGSTLSLSRTLLPSFLQFVHHEFPEIQVNVANTEEILNQILTGKIRCGLIEGNFNRQEFDAIYLKRDDFIAVTKNKSLLLKKQRIEDLLNERLLVRENGSGSLAILENWLGTENITLEDFPQKIEIPNPSTIIQVLKSGLGFSFLYRSLVEEELKSNELFEIPLQGLEISHPIHFVFLKNSYFTKEYETFALRLKEACCQKKQSK